MIKHRKGRKPLKKIILFAFTFCRCRNQIRCKSDYFRNKWNSNSNSNSNKEELSKKIPFPSLFTRINAPNNGLRFVRFVLKFAGICRFLLHKRSTSKISLKFPESAARINLCKDAFDQFQPNKKRITLKSSIGAESLHQNIDFYRKNNNNNNPKPRAETSRLPFSATKIQNYEQNSIERDWNGRSFSV